MKPVFQTQFGGKEGNCMQAAIASILELPLDEVPHLMLYSVDDWWGKYEEWAKQLGLQPIGIDPNGDWKPKGWHLIIGGSPRGDFDHVVVGFAGEPVHDPYPEGGCELTEVKAYEFFIELDPVREWKHVEG